MEERFFPQVGQGNGFLGEPTILAPPLSPVEEAEDRCGEEASVAPPDSE